MYPDKEFDIREYVKMGLWPEPGLSPDGAAAAVGVGGGVAAADSIGVVQQGHGERGQRSLSSWKSWMICQMCQLLTWCDVSHPLLIYTIRSDYVTARKMKGCMAARRTRH